MPQTRTSICRTCMNFCTVRVETEGNRIVGITGDHGNPIYDGYRCVKGTEHRKAYEHPQRLLHPLKRTERGFVEIPLDEAIGEVADRLETIIEQHGPRAIALYWGTYFGQESPLNYGFADAFMNAIGSRMVFSVVTIDQPGKQIAKGLHGMWMAPDQSLQAPRAALFVGTNPIVSHQGRLGPPSRLLRDFGEWGTTTIVIDPRRTETASRADIHLQTKPGEDPAILAGMIRVVLEEGLTDDVFLAANATGIDALRAAVAPFTPDLVAARASVPADDVVVAARAFARAGRGYANAGTGPNMALNGALVEYLLLCLQTLCGYWSRAGDPIPNALTLFPPDLQMTVAQALPPFPVTGLGEELRVRGLSQTFCGLPTAGLADEILTPGEGKVRALLSLGGSPASAIPDQTRTADALRALDLLVHTDVQMSPTGRLADYVFPSRLPYEMASSTMVPDFLSMFGVGWGYRESYAHYAPAVVDPPDGAEVVENWELLYRLGQAMDLELALYRGLGELGSVGDPVPIDMTGDPDFDALMDLIHSGSRVPLETVKAADGGALYPDPRVVVAPKADGWEGRLDVGNQDMMADLERFAAVVEDGDEAYPFRLLCRRSIHVMNQPTLAYPDNRPRYNPAFMHPDDLADLGLAAGDEVTLTSARASIPAVVGEDAQLRRGIVSMSHSFGDVPGGEAPGSNPGRLVDVVAPADRYTGQPRMSNIPIAVIPAAS